MLGIRREQIEKPTQRGRRKVKNTGNTSGADREANSEVSKEGEEYWEYVGSR